MVEWLAVAGITGLGAMIARSIHHYQRGSALWRELSAMPSFYLSNVWSPARFCVGFDDNQKMQKGLLIVTAKRIAIYTLPPHEKDYTPAFQIPVDQLQGFWRPVKYNDGINIIWIHATPDDRWHRLVLGLHKADMQRLIRALKAVAPPEQITAYRRQRPYYHRGATMAFPAEQSLQGDWVMEGAVELYHNPSYLSVWKAGIVTRIYDLTLIQEIAALKRMEGGKPNGLVRFQYGEEKVAFALDDYEEWARSLAESARRTLEDPLIRKRKSVDDED